jgi:hypothetical protein
MAEWEKEGWMAWVERMAVVKVVGRSMEMSVVEIEKC